MSMEKWTQESNKLAQEMEDYCNISYRNKICNRKCTPQMVRERRGVTYTLSGCRCDHMINARAKVFRDRIDSMIFGLVLMGRGIS